MTNGGVFDEPAGVTPLDPDDAAGLIPTWIATREDLNRAERENVDEAEIWALVQHGPWTQEELLKEPMMREIHRRMFDEVWRWAGDYRTSEVNIGAAPHAIPGRVRALLDDVSYQVSNFDELDWTADELAVRYHHRLVSIHPFPNGNGRHARLCADLLADVLGVPTFSWGGTSLREPSTVRDEYLAALHVADTEHDYAPLAAFARS